MLVWISEQEAERRQALIRPMSQQEERKRVELLKRQAAQLRAESKKNAKFSKCVDTRIQKGEITE